MKIVRPRFKRVCGQYLISIQMGNSTCSSKMDSFSFPGWRITSKSSTTSSSFTLFFFYFLKIFTCCFYAVLNVVICWISVEKAVEKVIYRLSTLKKKYVKESTVGGNNCTALQVGFWKHCKVHGRALVVDQWEKPMGFLRLEGKNIYA